MFHLTDKLERILKQMFYIKDIIVYFSLAVSLVSQNLSVYSATCQFTACMSGVQAKSISNTYMFSVYNLY